MSAGSFRGDAADSENNGARDLLRQQVAPRRPRFDRGGYQGCDAGIAK